MVTKVGMQSDFSDALRDLAQLDIDAAKAYQAAIERLDNEDYKSTLSDFKEDHDRHVKEITACLEKNNKSGPNVSGDFKSILTTGKVILANLVGDTAILRAMLSNEEDTNVAYETMNQRKDIWEDASDILVRGLEDEKRHKTWIESKLEIE